MALRKLYQYEEPEDGKSLLSEEEEAINNVSLEYEEDLDNFLKQISSPLSNKVCNVCGIRKHIKKALHVGDNLFDCLLAIDNPGIQSQNRFWWLFSSPEWDQAQPQTAHLCEVCFTSLSKSRVPLMSRASYPIGVTQLPSHLNSLSHLEQALLSPGLPMIFIYQHHRSGGQFQSFGQSVALQNDVEAIAKVLPRRPEDVCFTVSHRGI